MADRRISVALTVDGTDAQRGYAQAAQFAQQFGASSFAALGKATQATTAYTASVNQTTLAQQAQETAAQRFLSALERENQMIGLTRDQQLSLRASMLGVAAAAEPLVARWREVTAAAQAASAAEKQAADGAAYVASLGARANALGKTSAELMRMRAAELGVLDQAKPFIAQLEQSEKALGRTGVSAGQTAQAMRQLPMQMSDIVVSLQGGQAPLTVFLQQGAQIRDSFGGAGAAVKAFGGYVLGMVNPLTAAIAAAALIGYTALAGTREITALNTAVIATGNVAGQSAARLSQMADQWGAATNQFGVARESTLALAQAGVFTGRTMETALRGVVNGVSLTGKSVDDLVDTFKEIAKDPVSAIEKLSAQYGGLSLATYEQVRALQEQGKTQEAATLAATAFADVITDRNQQVRDGLALWEQSWEGIKLMAGQAAAAAKEFFRTATPEEARAKLLTGLQEKRLELLKEQEKTQKLVDKDPQGGFGRNLALINAEVAAVDKQLVSLNALANQSAETSSAQAAAAVQQKEAVAAMARVNKILDDAAPKAEKMDKALREYRQTLEKIRKEDPSSALLSPEKIAAAEKAIRDKYKDSSIGAAGQNAINGQIAALRAQQQGEESALKASLDEQKKLRDTSVTDLQQFYDNQYTLRASSLDRQLVIAQNEVKAASGKNELAAREQAKGRVAKIQQEIEQNEQQHVTNVRGIRDQYAADLTQQVAQWEEQARAAKEALGAEASLYGQTDAQRRIASAGLKVEADARKFLQSEQKKGIALTEQERKELDEKTAAQRRSAEQAEADMLAAQGAQSLFEQNRQFAVDSIIDERSRAAALVEIERQKWQALIAAATEGSEQQKNLIEALRTWEANQAARPQIEAQKRAYQSMISDWADTVDGVGEVFRDGFAAMLNGGKDSWSSFTKSLTTSFKTGVADVVYKMLAKPFVVQVIAGLAGAVTGSAGVAADVAKAAGGGSSLFGTAGNLVGAGSKIGDSILGGSGSVFGALGQSSLFSGTSFGAGLQVAGSTGLLGGLSTAVELAKAGQYASAAGAALPGIGTAVAGVMTAYQLLSGMFKGETRSGGTFAWEDGQSKFLHGPSGGTAGQESAVNAAISATANSVNDLLKGVGSAISVTSLIAGFEGSDKGRGGVMSGIRLSNGVQIGEDGSGSNYKGTYYNKDLPTTLSAETAAQLLVTDLQQLTVEALQAATDIPDAMRRIVSVTATGAEGVAAQLAAVSEQVNSVAQFTTFVDALEGPFEKLKGLTYDLKAGLIEAAGGVEPLTTNLASYYQNFTSEADRMGDTFSAMKKAVEGVGLVMPTTEEGFTSLVDGLINGLDETDTEGQKALATLLGLNGTFKQWSDYTVATAKETGEQQKALADKQSADVVTAFETQLAAVQKAASRASSLLSTRNSAGSTVDSIDTALGQTAGYAARREQELWASMQTASLEQQVSLAGELTGLVLERYQSEKANVQSLIDLGQSLRDYVKGLKVSDLSPLTLGQKLAEAATQYQDKLSKAQGGDQKALQELQGVAQAYLELQRRYSASGADYTSVFDSVTGALDGLGITTQTNADAQKQAATESLDQLQKLRGIADGAWGTLDRQYQHAVAASKSEMAGLEAIALKTGRLDDVASLLAGLPAELAAKLQPLLGTSTQVQGWYQNNLGRDADAGGLDFWSQAAANGATEQQFQAVASREQALVAAYKKLLGRVPDAAGRDFWLKSGVVASQFEAEIGKAAGLPGYAKGGFMSGMSIVGEAGTEVVDFDNPGRVYTNEQLGQALRGGSNGGSNAELVAEIRALNTRIGQLETALVESQNRNGQAIAQTVAAGADHVASSVGQSVKETSFEASQRKVQMA